MEGLSHGNVGNVTLAQDPLPVISDPRWEVAGKVSQLYLYPVKSFMGVPLTEAIVEKHGLSSGSFMDRQLMVTDGKHKFITGRQYPKLVLIECNISQKNSITFSAPNMPNLTVDLSTSGELIETDVFGSKCQGTDLGQDIGTWIGKFLEKEHLEFHMIYHDYNAKSSSRQLQESTAVEPMTKPNDVPLYADGFGYLLTTDASIDTLNEKLASKKTDVRVEHRRFRPNIVVEGTEGGFCEDHWLYIKINGTVFRNSKGCTRCTYTTVNPDYGTKEKDGEPLKTLKSFRYWYTRDELKKMKKAQTKIYFCRSTLNPAEKSMYGNSPFFGINLGLDHPGGQINVQDQVYVIKAPPAKSSLLTSLLWLQAPLFIGFLIKQYL